MLQPLSAFPSLQWFLDREPWLSDPTAVRGECWWEATGWGGHRYAFVMMTNGSERPLGMVMRDGALHYWRLYRNEILCVRDGDAWSLEIKQEPATGLLTTGGTDKHGRTWSLRVIQRPERWEVHVTYGGFIPSVREFSDQGEAELVAEEWLTEFYEAEDVA